jgi:AbrB family looped-hinge helix DNA binding protein
MGIKKKDYIIIEVPATIVRPWHRAEVEVEDKGWIRIPRQIRRQLGVRRGSRLVLAVVGERLVVVPQAGQRGREKLAELR